MSDEITTAMVDTYNTGIEMLAQQMSSKLKSRVRQESKGGERNAFDQVGAVAVSERTVRAGDTPYINSPHRRRWVETIDYDVGDLLDLPDMIRILNDPGGAYGRAFIAAFNRQRDAAILAAALATAYTGKTGTGTQAFDTTNNQIAAGGTGFTLSKVKQTMRILKAGSAVEADMDSEAGMNLNIAWTSYQEDEFLDTTEVKSIDYNTQRVLVDGGADRFYGFDFVRLEDWVDDVNSATHRIVPYSGSTRSCIAWVKDGLLLNEPQTPTVRVDQLPTKSYAWQYYAWGQFGATRMQETKVVQIDCAES